jgi:HK97 family phage portal protein
MLGSAATVAGQPINERTALQIVDVLACVRVLAHTASTLPLIAYARAADGARNRLEGGLLVELLRRPAPAVTQANLVGQVVASLALRGNAWLGKFRNAEGSIEQVGVLSPDRVTVEVKGGMPLYTISHENGRQTTHGVEDVLHVRMPLTLDGVLGLSPIAQAREALGLARLLGEQASALAANGSSPVGVLSIPAGPAQDDVMENLRRDFEARHKGAANAGRLAVLSAEVTYRAISLSPADAEWVAQRKLSTAEIARLFNVMPWMVNAPSDSAMTYSNTESQMRAFLIVSLSPYLVAVEQAITNDADLCAGPAVFVEFLRDAILQADSETRAAIYTAALDPVTGYMTRAEVRQRENLPPEQAPVEAVA